MLKAKITVESVHDSDTDTDSDTNIYKITTEGINENEFNTLKLKKNISKIKKCTYCTKYYDIDLIITNDKSFGNICKHCFYSINYDIIDIKNFEKICLKKGFCITDYIIKCHKDHDDKKCKHNMLNSEIKTSKLKTGCFLCDYKLNIDLGDIHNKNLLYKSDTIPVIKKDKVDDVPTDKKDKTELSFNIKKLKFPKNIIL